MLRKNPTHVAGAGIMPTTNQSVFASVSEVQACVDGVSIHPLCVQSSWLCTHAVCRHRSNVWAPPT